MLLIVCDGLRKSSATPVFDMQIFHNFPSQLSKYIFQVGQPMQTIRAWILNGLEQTERMAVQKETVNDFHTFIERLEATSICHFNN